MASRCFRGEHQLDGQATRLLLLSILLLYKATTTSFKQMAALLSARCSHRRYWSLLLPSYNNFRSGPKIIKQSKANSGQSLKHNT
jgi:hypothetical protein